VNSLLIFNHHSLPFSSKKFVEDSITEFLKICIKCRNIGFNTILVDDAVDANWFRLELYKGYYWQDWYNKHNDNVNRDLARAFRSIKINQPLFSVEDIDNHIDLYEIDFQGDTKFSALRAASWNDSPITSFPTTEFWKNSPLSVIKRTINQGGEIEEESGEIVNLYSLEVFESSRQTFLSDRNESISQGMDIYNKWDNFFPNLKNCGKVQEQLLHWSASNTILAQVLESLTKLNSFSEKWIGGDILAYTHQSLKEFGLNHQVSGESQSVRNDSSLKKEREFWLPNGVKVFFENHIKISNGYRIHFYPDSESKEIFIGYIGKHLKL